jgi:hypothetical protein
VIATTLQQAPGKPSPKARKKRPWYYHRRWQQDGHESPWDLQKLWGHPDDWPVWDLWMLDFLTADQETRIQNWSVWLRG